MSDCFDVDPRESDQHGECKHEIDRLNGIISRAMGALHHVYSCGDGHAVRAILREVPELDWMQDEKKK